MKKVISILCAAVICVFCAVPVFAAKDDKKNKKDEKPETTTTTTTTTTTRPVIAADDETAEIVFDWFEKFIVAESESKKDDAFEALLKMYEALKVKNVNDDESLSIKLKDIAKLNESEILPVFDDLAPVKTVFSRIMVDGDFDMKKAQTDIESSAAFAKILAAYTGANIVNTKGINADGTVENPKTGTDSTKTVIAAVLLVAGAGAIAVCSKKKED